METSEQGFPDSMDDIVQRNGICFLVDLQIRQLDGCQIAIDAVWNAAGFEHDVVAVILQSSQDEAGKQRWQENIC